MCQICPYFVVFFKKEYQILLYYPCYLVKLIIILLSLMPCISSFLRYVCKNVIVATAMRHFFYFFGPSDDLLLVGVEKKWHGISFSFLKG
jgi:hypothetical protein